MSKVKIVLLGSLPKGDLVRNDWKDWKQPYIKVLSKRLPNVEFIHGDSISDNVGASLVVGHDLAQIQLADMCLVDGTQKVGAGTAQEMVIAKYFEKPVIIVIPKNSHHRKSNIKFHGQVMEEWIHPFLKLSSDYVANSIDDAAIWIEKYIATPHKKVKNLSVFDKAIKEFEAYQKTNLD